MVRVPSERGPALGLFAWSRTAIWAAALFAWLVFEPNRNPLAGRWDDPTLTRDLGWVTDVWARWDSVWFLRIAEHGYGAASGAAAAFYPLYPLTLAGLDVAERQEDQLVGNDRERPRRRSHEREPEQQHDAAAVAIGQRPRHRRADESGELRDAEQRRRDARRDAARVDEVRAQEGQRG